MVHSNDCKNKTWQDRGYEDGYKFAREEADYDELAAIYRENGIPVYWDIFRAEILNKHMNAKDFDFKAYEKGFASAVIEFFSQI